MWDCGCDRVMVWEEEQNLTFKIPDLTFGTRFFYIPVVIKHS